MLTDNGYRRQKRLGIDHPAYRGNQELANDHNRIERDGRQNGNNILGASIKGLHENIAQLSGQLNALSDERREGAEMFITNLDQAIQFEIEHLAGLLHSAQDFKHRSLLLNFFLSVLRSQEVQQHPVVQTWLKDSAASPQLVARIMQQGFAGLPRDLQELILTTHADQVVVERTRFQERVRAYKAEFHVQAIEYVRKQNLPIDEQLIIDRLDKIVIDVGDSMRAEFSDVIQVGEHEVDNDRIIVALHPMLLGIDDDTASSRAAALREEKMTVMHELVHAVISGQQPAVQISGSPDHKAAIDDIIDRLIPSDDPEMFGPDGLIYDPLFAVDANMDYFFMKHGMSFQGTPNRDLRWLNEAMTSDIQHVMFPQESAADTVYQDEIALYAELKKSIPEELFLRAYAENALQESPTTVSSPVHAKALLRAIDDAFAPGFYVRLQRYIYKHSVKDAINMMRAHRWREELFPQKKV